MKNVVLIGFMGTGKTSTGRILAQRLGRAFVDLDTKIEEEAGRSIPEIFAHVGDRPVLDRKDAGDRRRAVEDLMAERRSLYEVADYSLDTSELSPLQVVDDIIGYLKREGVFRA